MVEATVSVATLPRITRLSVRAGPSAIAAIGRALDVVLGETACRASVTGERVALWLGPDEWLVLAPDELAPTLAARAAAALGAEPASIVDVSHSTVALEVAGPNAVLALNAFCALDLDLRVFPPGACTRTLLGKAEVVLWRIAPDLFRIEVGRSYAEYAYACLEAAAREFSL